MSLAQILEAIAVVVLSSYFIIITFSFFKFRLSRKKEQLSSLISNLKLDAGNFDLQKNFDREFSRNDYLLPVIFVSLLSFFGIFLLLLGWLLYDQPGDAALVKSMLWSGSEFWNDEVYGREKKSLTVVAWALFGGYLSGGQYIYRRFSTIDLTPGNFFSIGIRMVLAPIISLMLSYLITSDDPSSVYSNGILVIAFLTGLFPERGLRLLLDKSSSFFPSKNDKEVKNMPLESIEGISYMHRLRLNEVGIDNVQNLAQFNFLLLIIKTPFPARILLDWVSQAKLLMEFREYAPELHRVGIRSALDYMDAMDENEDRLTEIARITGLEPLMLEINYKNLKGDKSVWLLDHFRQNLEQISLR